MTWDQWIQHHTETFGLSSDERLASVAKWAGMFERHGWTPEEMAAASDSLGMSGRASVQFLDAHLRDLLDAARSARAKAARLAAREDPEWRECADCGGSGGVSVPSWWAARGRWTTAVVYCTCNAGVRSREGQAGYWAEKGKPPPMSLEVYESLNPGWREHAIVWRPSSLVSGPVVP